MTRAPDNRALCIEIVDGEIQGVPRRIVDVSETRPRLIDPVSSFRVHGRLHDRIPDRQVREADDYPVRHPQVERRIDLRELSVDRLEVSCAVQAVLCHRGPWIFPWSSMTYGVSGFSDRRSKLAESVRSRSNSTG